MSIYSDLNSITPEIQPLLFDIQSIYQSLFNIFNTRPGERHFLPEFGIDIEDELFELIDDLSELELYRKIVEAVERWEGRVSIDTSRTTVTADPDNNTFEVDLYFTINSLDSQTFQFQQSFTR